MARYDRLISDELLPAWRAEREKLDRIDDWLRWNHGPPVSAASQTREHRELAGQSQTPLGALIVDAITQELYVEGYRRSGDPEDPGPWRIWQVNGMDARQIALHRTACGYGEAHLLVLPGTTTLGEPIPVMRPLSPREAVAFWDDPASDDWPHFLLRVQPGRVHGDPGLVIHLYDDGEVWRYHARPDGSDLTYITHEVHGVGVCPSVRFSNQLDLEGRTPGEVEPVIPLLARIDQTTFDRLLVQRHASWKVRTISGMTLPDEDEHRHREKLRLSVAEILIAEDADTKFGSLPETSPKGFIDSEKHDLQMLAATTQTPAYELLGDLINLSAEALVAARASLARKADERRHVFGRSHEQALRLGARIMGDLGAAQDWGSQVLWKDTEGRSLGQAADALGKLAQMVGVPVEMLWEKIPGWTQTDVERAKKLAAEAGNGEMDLLLRDALRSMRPDGAHR